VRIEGSTKFSERVKLRKEFSKENKEESDKKELNKNDVEDINKELLKVWNK
jgi:hypothetical protein